MSKSEVIEAIRAAAGKLGRVPATAELEPLCGIPRNLIRRHFGSLRQALRAAGFQPGPELIRLTSRSMLEDWGAVARKLGHLPSGRQYNLAGRYCASAFSKRFGSWARVPPKFQEWTRENEEQEQWRDVVELIAAKRGPTTPPGAVNGLVSQTPELGGARHHSSVFPDRPVFGAPVQVPGLAYEPVNEAGVIFLFGIIGLRLGFHVERLQAGFPDCEAVREIQPGKWQRVRVEFEFESRNFLIHRHPAGQCDVIVCWRHNWSDCPSNLEVIELSQACGL
jgi:hypothetical protein